MNTHPSQRRNRLIYIVPVTLILVVVSMILKRRSESRPQIDIRNTGATSIILRHDSDSSVVPPNHTWTFRFSPGDTLTIFAGETDSTPSKTVALPGGSRFLSAETKVEGQTNIMFQFKE
jgi:hypothetical protein